MLLQYAPNDNRIFFPSQRLVDTTAARIATAAVLRSDNFIDFVFFVFRNCIQELNLDDDVVVDVVVVYFACTSCLNFS